MKRISPSLNSRFWQTVTEFGKNFIPRVLWIFWGIICSCPFGGWFIFMYGIGWYWNGSLFGSQYALDDHLGKRSGIHPAKLETWITWPLWLLRPAIWACWCEWSHIRLSKVSHMVRDDVWTLVFFSIGSWLFGCLRPSMHWSSRAGKEACKNSSNALCFHRPDVHGFSIWICLPSASWILAIKLQSLMCTWEFSWAWQTRWNPETLRWALKRFHALHGLQSGASHTCFGRNSRISVRSFTLPEVVLKSPSSLVKRFACKPQAIAVSVRWLLG